MKLLLLALGGALLFSPEVRSLNLADVPCGKIARGSRRQHARVMGGSPAKITDYPHAVSLRMNGNHVCGGTLVDRRHILTAAHCTYNYHPKFFEVAVGDQNTADMTEPGQQLHLIDTITSHPEYRWRRFSHDIAVIKLETPVSWTNHVQPACVPTAGDDDQANSKKAFIAGYGNNRESRDGGKQTSELNVAYLPIVRRPVCKNWYLSQGESDSVITEDVICAGFDDGKIDGCQGDSGGGLLVHDESNQGVLVGIMSAGVGCGREKLPGLYTKVNKYLGWIQKTIYS